MSTISVSDVLEWDSVIVSCEASGEHWAVQLDSTVFHPQGRGQPADAGWINACPVLAVEVHGDAIHHIVACPLELGPARLQLDQHTRGLHSRLHSAGHLIGYAGIAQGLMPSKAQHWPGASRVVFECQDGQSLDLATMIEQNLARHCTIHDGLRVVGFGPLQPFPCGGTHVPGLADIGGVRLLAMKRKKDLLTLSYEVVSTPST